MVRRFLRFSHREISIKKTRRYSVEKTGQGIYTVKGDIIPMQIIDNRELSAEENLWLKNLSNRLNPKEIRQLSGELVIQGKTARIQAYINAIAKANFKAIEEAIRMGDAALSFDDVFERTGLATLAAKWEARGEARGETRGRKSEAIAIAYNMVNAGFTPETVASLTRLDLEKVKEFYKTDNK